MVTRLVPRIEQNFKSRTRKINLMGWKRRFGELEAVARVVSTATGTSGLMTSYHNDVNCTRIHFSGTSVPFALNYDTSLKTEFVKVLYGCSDVASATFQIVNVSNGVPVLGTTSPLSEANGTMITTQLYTASLRTDKGALTGSGGTLYMLSGTVDSSDATFNPLFVNVFWRNSTTWSS